MIVGVILYIEIKHFQPFVNTKNAIFIVLSSLFGIILFLKIMCKGEFKFSYNIINLFAVSYLIWNIISYFIFQYTSKIYLILTICYIFIFFIIQYFFQSKDILKIFYTFSGINIIMGFYGIMQFLGRDFAFFVNYFGSRFEIGTRVFTTLGNPNLQGGYSVFMLPITVAFVIYTYRLFRKDVQKGLNKNKLLFLFSILSFILNVLLLLMAQTRGSWIAGVVTSVVFVILYYWKKEFTFFKKHILKTCIFIILIILGGFFVFSILPETIVNPQTVDIRLFYYQNTVDMIFENPKTLLFGRGIGSFSAYYPQFRDKRVAFELGETNLEFRVEHPHNEHLEILSDMGILGYLMFLGIVIVALFLLLKKNDILSIGLATAIVGILIDGFMMQNLRFVSIAILLWVALGLSTVEILKVKEKLLKIKMNGIWILIFSISVILLIVVAFFGINHYQQGELIKSGLFHYTTENNQNAVHFLQQSYDKDSTDKRTLYYLAPSYEGIGDDEKALFYYKRLLELDHNFIQANSHVAMIYFRNDDNANAIRYFLRQIRSNNMFWRPYYMLAFIFVREGNIEQAFKNSVELLEINKLSRIPDEVLIFALKVKAQYYSQNQDIENLFVIYQRLYEVLPDGDEKDQIRDVLNS